MIKVLHAIDGESLGRSREVVAMIASGLQEKAVPSAYGHRGRADAHRYFEKI